MMHTLVPVLLKGTHYFILFCLGFCLIYGMTGYGAQPTEETKRMWMQGILLYASLMVLYLLLYWFLKKLVNRLGKDRD